MAIGSKRSLAFGALAFVILLVVVASVVLGINLSNDAHRNRVVKSMVVSLRPGMTANQAQAVFDLHGLSYSRHQDRIAGIVRTPKGSIKIVQTDTRVTALLEQGLVSSVRTEDVDTGP